MRLAFQLAYKNLFGAGLRTCLNSIVLSFAFVIIIFFNGLYAGWAQQSTREGIDWEYANGHLVNENYDVYDPFTIQDAHAILPEDEQDNLTPILVRQASLYPQGRMISAVLKGIDVKQTVLKLPTHLLVNSKAQTPVLIGRRMAKTIGLKVGDEILVRWRDNKGTYDACNATIAGIFNTNVATVDAGQMWMSIDQLWRMTGLKNHASMFVASDKYKLKYIKGWRFEDRTFLLKELTNMIEAESISGAVMYLLVLLIGLLAVFDTQVLSVFRRQKEIGTYISLGMTRREVVKIFTAEGAMYSVFAVVLGAIYGIPSLWYLAHAGIGLPVSGDDYGVILADRIYPVYSYTLVFGTILLVIGSATIVSFLPARKIAKMNPVEALKGKLL